LSEIWKNLGKGMRIGILSLVGVLVFGGALFALHSQRNTYVDLFPTKMTTSDVNEISAALTEMRIDHQINETSDGVLLHPSKKGQAQGMLAQRSLPRHKVLLPSEVEGGMGKTAMEQEATRQQLLEGEITMAFRAMDGINDAQVKLAVPKKTYFQDDNKRTTARVMLSLKPEADINREKIKAMVNLVAASVPELRAEDVTIVDTASRDLTAMVPKDDATGGLVASGTNLEIQASEEKRLEQKAQAKLDEMWPGKTKVGVNLEMDFSKIEEERFTPGGAADDGVVVQSRQIKREQLDRSGAGAGGEEATQLGSGGGDKGKGDYVHEVESTNNLVAQDKYKRVDTGFRVKRLSVAVVADNVSEKELAAIAGFVGPSIGLDEARGDKITAYSVPFDRAMNVPVVDPMPAMGAGQQQGGDSMPAGALAMVAVAGAAMMLVVLGMFLFKQHSVRGDQGTIITSTAGGITSTAITDHFTDKSGKTTAPTGSAGATQVNTTDQLEQLVKERPTKVAEMLKSTWLS
jgi:flagellar M-ring protein FliF